MLLRLGPALILMVLFAHTAQALAGSSSAAVVPDEQSPGTMPPTPAKPLGVLDADYPLQALLADQRGDVTLRVFVKPDGSVLASQTLMSSGVVTLDEAAREVAKAWVFAPAMMGGRPVQGSVTIKVFWKLPAQLADQYRSDVPAMANLNSMESVDFKPPVPITSHAITASDFPRDALARGVSGTALVKYLVLEDGTVGETRIESAGGFPSIDKSAQAVAKRWKFQPALFNGQPVRIWQHMQAIFTIGPSSPNFDAMRLCRTEPYLSESTRMTVAGNEKEIRVERWLHIDKDGFANQVIVHTDGGWMQMSDEFVKTAFRVPVAAAQNGRAPSCWISNDITVKVK